ncbi:tetratricopeptide repeat protein [Algoriphagus sp.]|uniref:tetratricopeptide repeat protein n=1 Tax=Algoriphagus sp. TaxID=1872435 RepID=UPI003F71BC7B
MKIETQNAETIYNIAGNMQLHNSEEVVALLNKDKQEKLKELNSISFFDLLSKEYSDRNLIERDNETALIKNRLDEKHQLILHGEPGIGKTTILFQLSRKLENLVYISVKGKSPISVISYLINKIRISNGKDLLEIKTIDEAFDWLQSSLQKSKQCFIIDDCEQDQETITKIIALNKFETTFLFATRNNLLFESSGIDFHSCSPFSEEEVNQFLKAQGLLLNKLEFNDILYASNGNPLYLYYFSKYQISPLPSNLVEYQNSIWSGLSSSQQEIIALISIPYFNITSSELAEVLKCELNLHFTKEIDSLSSLVKNHKGVLELFHPSFKEFILEKLESKGLLNFYKEKLGVYYLEKEEIVQATYLLIDFAPSKIDKYLIDVFPSLISWGELSFALKVLNTKLKTSEKNLEKGYLYYHLCHVHHLLGNKNESTISIDKSLDHLKSAKNKKFYAAALMFKAMDLIEHGDVVEATRIADKVFLKIKDKDNDFKAPILVNLSKIYVDLFEFEKGAKACKEAFEIFEEKGYKEGMINSLVNLVSCLTQINEHKNEAEKYGLKLLGIIEQTSEFSIEVIVLNALASIYRSKEDFPKAKEYCNRAIELCQKYEMKDRVILNLINYGNILRDEGDIDGAKKIYNESLIKTKESNLKKEESRIYWILSSIQRDLNDLESSIEFADKSIKNGKEINFYYGVANALKEKSETYLLMKEPIKAAEALVESGEYFAKIDQFYESYQRNISKAIELYNKAGEKIKANEVLNKLIIVVAQKNNVDDAIGLIVNSSDVETIKTNFEKLFRNYFSNENGSNIIKSFLSFVNYCKGLNEIEGKELFKIIIDLIIKNLGKKKFSYCILAIAIEQSGKLLDQDDINHIADHLQTKLPLFSSREINDQKIFITSIFGKINLEIHTFIDELICNKLALSLVLILHEGPELIIDEDPFIEESCVVWLHSYSDQMQKAIGEYLSSEKTKLFTENVQSLHMSKNGYDIHEMIIVNPDYEIHSNLNTFPDNKASFYFFFLTIMGIKAHFYHTEVQEDNIQRRFILNSLARMFDYTNTSLDNDTKKSDFEINIDKIKTE